MNEILELERWVYWMNLFTALCIGLSFGVLLAGAFYHRLVAKLLRDVKALNKAYAALYDIVIELRQRVGERDG